MNVLIKLLILIVFYSTSYADDSIDIARVSLHEATQKILSDSNKRVLGATTQIIDGKEVHIIKVLTPDGRILHYKIDAETGAIIG
jgi:uncharacterized membrane protein YkoI